MLKRKTSLYLAAAITFCSSIQASDIQQPVLEISESIVSYEDLRLKQVEKRIDSMDVYALAPSAYKLKTGHMLSPELYKDIKNKKIDDFKEPILRASKASGIEKELIAAVIYVESGFKTDAVSHKGAAGLMQLMPGTLADLGVKNPYDVNENIGAGSSYLKTQILRFKSLDKALAAYNAGPGHVLKYGGIPPFKETVNFVKKVLAKYSQYKNSGVFK